MSVSCFLTNFLFFSPTQRFLQDKGYYVPSFSADAGQIKSNGDELSSALRDFQRFVSLVYLRSCVHFIH